MDTFTTKGYILIIFRTVMADHAIVIKACSKIVCHALSRIKRQTMLWILFSDFTGLLITVYLHLFFMLGRLYRVIAYLYPIFSCKDHYAM